MIKKCLLKSFFILGLILLPIYFSSALDQNFYLNTPATILDGQNNDLELLRNVNFLLNDQYEMISVMSAGTYPRLKNIFWTQDGLYFIDSCQGGYSCQNINTSIKVQGYIQNYYECDLDGNVCDTNSSTYSSEQFFTNNSYSNPDYMLLSDTLRDESPLFVCFAYSGLNKMICFMGYENAGNLDNSLGFTYNPLPSQIYSSEDQISSYFWSSPFVSSSSSVPDYEFNENDDFTNQQIIEGYNAMGLTDHFCYGGFDINNIFEAGTIPQEFTGYKWGGGAFIFDIWNIYSGAYNNDYISFLRSFYVSYVNNNYSDFYGKTKALYGFFNQWFSVSSKGLGFVEATAPTFTLIDVWQYCDLKFNLDPHAIYTGDRRDPKFSYYTSGNVNLGGYFNFSGNNNYFSGTLSGFNTPKDFFASLNSIFQGGFKNLETREPVLPTYIIVFLLAIIFIRIISH